MFIVFKLVLNNHIFKINIGLLKYRLIRHFNRNQNLYDSF